MTTEPADGPRLLVHLTRSRPADLTPEALAYVREQVAAMPAPTAEQIAATNALVRPHLNRRAAAAGALILAVALSVTAPADSDVQASGPSSTAPAVKTPFRSN